MISKRILFLSVVGAVLGVVLFLEGYSRYYSACFPNGPVVSAFCRYPGEPYDIGLAVFGALLFLVSLGFLLLSLLRPSFFAPRSGTAPRAQSDIG